MGAEVARLGRKRTVEGRSELSLLHKGCISRPLGCSIFQQSLLPPVLYTAAGAFSQQGMAGHLVDCHNSRKAKALCVR